MPPERRRTVAEVDTDLSAHTAQTRQWQEGHEKQCAERYQGIRDDVKEVRGMLERVSERMFAHPVPVAAAAIPTPAPKPQGWGDRLKLWGVVVALLGGLAGAVDVLAKIAVGFQTFLNPPPHG